MPEEVMSHRIVRFLTGLRPIYDHVWGSGGLCARSLLDGTLVLPYVDKEETEDEEQYRVLVHWQGDAAKQSIENGNHLVGLALSRYADYHAQSGMAKDSKAIFMGLARHYEFKTGSYLHAMPRFATDDQAETIRAWSGAMTKFGRDVLIGLVAAKIGA